MAKHHAGRRGRGIVRDTINTTVESFDGLMLTLATMFPWLWKQRMRRPQLVFVMAQAGNEADERPNLWRERSVWVELSAILAAWGVGLWFGFGALASGWLLGLFVMFLSVEADNTTTEFLIDSYQATKEAPGTHNEFVKLIKHVAGSVTLKLNLLGVLGYGFFLWFPDAHLVLN